MSAEAFVVAFHDGYWRIAYEGQWYELYPDQASAERAAVSIAKQMGELPTRVVARESDGTEEVVWQPANHDKGKPTAQ
jgi:hypothetical protein